MEQSNIEIICTRKMNLGDNKILPDPARAAPRVGRDGRIQLTM